jgi:hypothetical protein
LLATSARGPPSWQQFQGYVDKDKHKTRNSYGTQMFVLPRAADVTTRQHQETTNYKSWEQVRSKDSGRLVTKVYSERCNDHQGEAEGKRVADMVYGPPCPEFFAHN